MDNEVMEIIIGRLCYPDIKPNCAFPPDRHGFLKLSLLLLLLLLPIIASAAEQKASITEPAIVPLQLGMNKIDRFASDGRPAIIAKGWRENWNAHGYNFFLVLMPSSMGKTDWNVVDIVSEEQDPSDFIRDYPHTEDDFVRSVRFARAKLNGVATTLLITATRETADMPIPHPSIVIFEVYKLEKNHEIGTTRDIFKRVLKWQSNKKYSNSDVALQKELGLPGQNNIEGQ